MSKPDTNQASELFELHELCKEVYEKTGWEAPETYKAEDGNPENDWQAYDTDYLLEKLPKHVDYLSLNQNNKLTVDSSDGEKGKWYAHYWLRSRRLQVSSDTPLKALLRLTIALSEAGELK